MPGIYSLWIVGRNGGLLYNWDFLPLPGLDFNDKLRLASSWFGMCSIAAQLSPVPDSSEIRLLHADTFDLHSYQTLTGTLFMLLTMPGTADASDTLQGPIYDLYTDYVLKNPFCEMDQVIKADQFDSHLAAAIGNRRGHPGRFCTDFLGRAHWAFGPRQYLNTQEDRTRPQQRHLRISIPMEALHAPSHSIAWSDHDVLLGNGRTNSRRHVTFSFKSTWSSIKMKWSSWRRRTTDWLEESLGRHKSPAML